ncbi:MAG: hypothetical protein ABSF14_21250 [Terriglobia bacterium]|jgi:hypothetical protein
MHLGESDESTEKTSESTKRLGDNASNLYKADIDESKKYKIENKSNKILKPYAYPVGDSEDDKVVYVKPLENREQITFKTGRIFKLVYDRMYKFLKLKKGSKYSKQVMWDDLVRYGNKNLQKKERVLIDSYKELRDGARIVLDLEIPQPLNLIKEGRTHVMNVYTTKDQSEIIEEIEESYFLDDPPFRDLPYLMLMVSFIYSDYDNNSLAIFREHMEPYYNQIMLYINSIDRTIYELNIGILQKIKDASPNDVFYLLKYCNKLTTLLDDRTDKLIVRQAELIIEFCQWIKENEEHYYTYLPKRNENIKKEEMDKLIEWAETYRKNISKSSSEKTDTEKGIF